MSAINHQFAFLIDDFRRRLGRPRTTVPVVLALIVIRGLSWDSFTIGCIRRDRRGSACPPTMTGRTWRL